MGRNIRDVVVGKQMKGKKFIKDSGDKFYEP